MSKVLEMSQTQLEMYRREEIVIVWDTWWESSPPLSGADHRGLLVKIIEVRDDGVMIETINKRIGTSLVPISELKTFDQFVFDVMNQPMAGR